MIKQYIATFSTFDGAVAFLAQLTLETAMPLQGYFIEPSSSMPNAAIASRQWTVGKLA